MQLGEPIRRRTIPETLAALDELAKCAHDDPACVADDLSEAEFILATCTPELSGAAFHAMMGRYVRARDRALRELSA